MAASGRYLTLTFVTGRFRQTERRELVKAVIQRGQKSTLRPKPDDRLETVSKTANEPNGNVQ